jgi:choline dehydrogenase-like flavoprotein
VTAKILGNQSLSSFDALIVGTGAGGGTAAHILCKAGLKVLVLEAGPNWFDSLDDPANQPVPRFSNDELKIIQRRQLVPNVNVEPRTFRTAPSDGDRVLVGDVNPLPKTVGGGTVHADLKAPRFQPMDFQLGTMLGAVQGASFADWPVQYDQLEPFYTYIEKTAGVQGIKGADPFEGPRSTDLPMPPGLPMYLATVISKGLQSLGYHPFPYPTMVNSQPYDGRPACCDCGFCTSFGCPSNAKGSSAVTMLRKALLTGRCLVYAETRVVKIVLDGAKKAVTGVQAIGPDGSMQTFTADRYILAANSIEDARLLFLSDPAGVGNSSGQVGRNVTFHIENVAVGVFEERLHGHRGRTVTHGFSDFRGTPGSTTAPLGGIVEIGAGQHPIEETGQYTQALSLIGGGFSGARFKSLMRQSPLRDHLAALTMHGEDAPQPTNLVDLDPAVKDLDGLPVARITYKNHPFELNARDVYGPKLVQILGASGAKWAFLAPIDTVPTSAHTMGTLRFGPDPKTSVCDPTGKFNDIGNLWACDGSLLPTSSGYNPTLTIMALAAYVAGGIAYPGSPDQALG